MPTYEYVCQKCQHEFETFQSMKDKPLTKCPQPKCGGKVKRKLGTGAGLIFKGSGFYITDYRSDAYKSAAKKDSAASTSGGDSGSAAKTGDAKPTAKKEAAKKPAAKKE